MSLEQLLSYLCLSIVCIVGLTWVKKRTDLILFFFLLALLISKMIPFPQPRDLNTESSSLYGGIDHEMDVRSNAEGPSLEACECSPPTHLLLVKCLLIWPLKSEGVLVSMRFSELSPRMHVQGFDGHWVHCGDFRDCLPLIFSRDSRLPIIQQGLGPGEQLGEGRVLTRARMYPREDHCPYSRLHRHGGKIVHGVNVWTESMWHP